MPILILDFGLGERNLTVAAGSRLGPYEILEPLLKIPYLLLPGWLKIDPNFDPLRKNPGFQKLVAGAK